MLGEPGRATRGRPPLGPELLANLEGSARAKERLEAILETMAGRWTVAEACRRLGIAEGTFHELRREVLQRMLGNLEPKPTGRPRNPEPTEPEIENEALRAQLREMKIDLEAARIREEIAVTMPYLLARGMPHRGTGDKKKARRRRERAALLGNLPSPAGGGTCDAPAPDHRGAGGDGEKAETAPPNGPVGASERGA